MTFPYLDASALLKRYYLEAGSAEMDHLFGRVPLDRVIILSVGYTEVASVLKRRQNSGRLTPLMYRQALDKLTVEVGPASAVRLVGVDSRLADAAIRHVDAHSVNSTDAILLESAVQIAALIRTAGDNLMVVASDLRLLRAVKAEGLDTFDPESKSTADPDALLGP
jgi:predicted nucleic acid-binding protein